MSDDDRIYRAIIGVTKDGELVKRLTISEASREFGVTRPTVRAAVHRAASKREEAYKLLKGIQGL